MTGIKRAVIIIAVMTFMIPLAVSAQEALSSERMAAIKTNCNVITSNLLQAQRRDLVTRTNRGRAYEAVLKQMEAFQQRVRNNKLSTESFDQALTSFEIATNNFRNAYVRYDNSLIALRQIDCREKPEAFATALEEARKLRDETGAAIAVTDQSLVEYRVAMLALQQSLAPATEGTE